MLDPHLEPLRFIIGLTLMPPLSMFVYESAEYIKRQYPTVPMIQNLLQPHQELLRRSRLRLKLLDDSYKSFEDILENASQLVAINSSWFLQGHRGVLRSLKRLLQSDLGIYFIENEVVCTTHVAFLNMGLTKEELSTSSLSQETLGPYLRDITEDFGQYMSILLQGLGIGVDAAYTPLTAPVPPIQFCDLKSKRFYEAIVRQIGPRRGSVGLLLTSILSQVNTARILIPRITEDNEAAAFKVRFVSLFHAISSLQKLLGQHHKGPLLHAPAEEQIRAILSEASIRTIRKNRYRKLRNNLVHYGVDKSVASHLSPNLPLFGLVEAHTSGRSFADVAADVERSLEHVSSELQDLLPQALSPQGTL